jgi:hypothetical protein
MRRPATSPEKAEIVRELMPVCAIHLRNLPVRGAKR